MQHILAEQLRILFTRAPVVYSINILVAAVSMIVLWGVVPEVRLVVWCMSIIALSLLRFYYLHVYRKESGSRLELWRRFSITTSLFSGFLWGGMGAALFPEGSIVYQCYLLLVVSGMLAGAVSSWSVYRPAFNAYFLPAGSIFALRLAFAAFDTGSGVMLGLALLFSAFAISLYLMAQNAYRVLLDSLNNQFEKQALAYSLEEKKREAERSEANLKRAHRALQAISECNKSMVRANLETELLHEFCGILVKRGGYRFAWVGLAQSASKDIIPVASAGFDDGYLETGRFSWDEDEAGSGPVGMAVRTGDAVVIGNLMLDPRFKPWRKEAVRRGYASMIALPLKTGGVTGGVLNIYASEQDAFDKEETDLLMQLSDDLAYGVQSLRTRTEIARQAWHDPLTGLPNRSLLRDRMRQAMASAKRTGRMLAILFLDLDGFKQINDQYGHASGDVLIREVSARLVSSVRAGDTVSRLGGDEFVILLDVSSVEEMRQCIARIMNEIRRPISLDGQDALISSSIGVTLFPQNDADADALIRHADMAMYQAKQSGRNCYRIFDVNMDLTARIGFQMRDRIAQAIDRQELCLYYQPKVNLRTGRLFGVEALIRWNHPEKGLLPPVEFLPFAEGSDLIVRIGDWVIGEALRQVSSWHEAGIEIEVSVNVASEQLHEPGFSAKLKAAIDRYPNIEPKHLELEVLESTALQDIRLVKQVLGECKALGVMLSLDDFGTGYSSLAYLRHLPVDTLKIDQSFVRDMIEDREDLAVIEGVISLAKIFDLDLIAEGVESAEHGSLLLKLGCDKAQGYGIAKPMHAERLQEWLVAGRTDSIGNLDWMGNEEFSFEHAD
jgi:diguanylate cyclase (GGDEF)-like protein